MFDRFVVAILCAFVFLLPLPLGTYRPWAIMLLSSMVCCIFLLHLLNAAITGNKAIFEFKKSTFLYFSLSFVFALLCFQLLPTQFSSIDPYQTKTMGLKTMAMILFVGLLFSYINSPKRLKLFVVSIISAGVIQAIYASYLNLMPDVTSIVFSKPHTDRAVGSFTYQNFLANYLALSLSLGIGLLVSELKVTTTSHITTKQIMRDFIGTLLSNKMLFRGALILMIIGLILTRSRMGNSAFFLSLAAVSLFAFFFYKNRPKYLRLLIMSFFVLDLILIGAMFGVEKVKERLVETSLTSETRDEVVRDSLSLILDKPLIGHGGGTFYTAFPSVKPQAYSGFYDNAHNDYVQFTVEIGLIGTAVLGLLVLYALVLCLKIMMKNSNQLCQGVAFGCAIAIIHMLLHSTVDYSLQAGANSFTFISILTLVFIINSFPKEKKKRRSYTESH